MKMKCEKCREVKTCGKIVFGKIKDDKILYLCKDCSNWLYSYIINNVFDSDDDSDDSDDSNDSDGCYFENIVLAKHVHDKPRR